MKNLKLTKWESKSQAQYQNWQLHDCYNTKKDWIYYQTTVKYKATQFSLSINPILDGGGANLPPPQPVF